ncbi:MAG: transketolase [Bacteroidales bacterium]|nr:transketolase [Bacteroidales bacterium]
MNKQVIDKAADNIRLLSAAMVEKAKSGHPGGAMGGADFINVLFSEFLVYDPDDMNWAFRDRFFLDPGHMSPMLYGALTLRGHYSIDDIKEFRQWGSPTPGHPEIDFSRGVENTSGPLGQGHTMAVGAAIAERVIANRFGDWSEHKIYTFISDGGIQEEISQGAGRIAGYLGLNNLVMFYDSNNIQLSTDTSAVTVEDTASKYKAWGWQVYSIDGNNQDQIRKALVEAISETEKPVLIIGETVMGKGCVVADGQSFEGQSSTHGQPISKAGASFEKTVINLGGSTDNPFVIFPEVAEYYEKVKLAKKEKAAERKAKEFAWKSENPSESDRLQKWLTGTLPVLDWESISQKNNVASRAASGAVLEYLAENLDNLIVMSADLANSDKTDSFLKKTSAFTHKNFSGAFMHVGVSELTMATIANGIAVHGGLIPACGTFFVFSDYMKPAVRLAGLMELQVIYIWTHDAFRVGEDGPTHQPIEHESQIRLMEQLKNHSGAPSVIVLRPADAMETTVAWKLAVENQKTPTALLLSRQNISDLPVLKEGNAYTQALQTELGAYVVKEFDGRADVTMIGNGSEVSTLLDGALLLEQRKGLKVRVVSAPSEGLFRLQDKDYQNTVIPSDIPVFGLTAGLPSSLAGLAGADSLIAGLDHFGYSAPAEVLDEKFGYTAEAVYDKVSKWLDK